MDFISLISVFVGFAILMFFGLDWILSLIGSILIAVIIDNVDITNTNTIPHPQIEQNQTRI